MIESGSVFNHKGQTWEVKKYDSYEDKYSCQNLDSHNFKQGKFSELEVKEGLNCKSL